ncbi:MAG: peroxide stress protein YaaA [Lachnospiraceae bacterium]|nr:peroxide stress protein YaaA [Lachnospiraceae bacterium]
MKIIISPAKKMRTDTDTYPVKGAPALLDRTRRIMEYMKALTYPEAKKLWKCNDKIAQENFERFRYMDLEKNLTPAVISYDGIQYQYMAPGVFTRDELEYIDAHLNILSGFYGVARPFDGVTPYRLEMQAKASVEKAKDLYEFWGDSIYQCVMQDNADRTVINLASKEYSKCVEQYLTQQDTFITCVFGELSGEKVIQKGTQAKMARGEMVRYMAAHNVTEVSMLKNFSELGYTFDAERSNDREYVFLK